MSDSLREKAAKFGLDHELTGIVTLPGEREVVGSTLPYVVLLNSGILHRVGASRLYVYLARALAVIGIPSLRFDLSGIGDSPPRRDVATLRESVELDIDDALSYLSHAYAAKRFILMGLCSGAYDALYACTARESVVGGVLIDIPGPFRTWRHHFYHFGSRIFRLSSWRQPGKKFARYSRAVIKALQRRALLSTPPRVVAPDSLRAADNENNDQQPARGTDLSAPNGISSDSTMEELGARSSGTHQVMQETFQSVLDKGGKLFVIFTPGFEDNYNHRSQFRTTFPQIFTHPNLSFEYFPKADHVFSASIERTNLIKTIVSWIERVDLTRAFGAVESEQEELII